MQKGNLSRDEAVSIVGEAAVKAVESENCEPTNRLGYNGECQGNELTEWAASVRTKGSDGDAVTLTAYYYTDNTEDAAITAADGDGSVIGWQISGFEVK